ncbi:unnamed protein product [Bursaphelenchus xylophilus]|uniref:(pine wood nematode) hypothetical protein n=1 Tax=Bursaphelenchus xylophilus TaxID=6326 RepID=A0A1I7RRD7_BURXY|nr:unnamed protein product [Bursaphelenchus xylophilus]CAG9130963.1 unnamed protein product [Bursaphelenchus xylophilus]
MRGVTELEKRRTAETIVNLLKSQLFYIAFYRLVGETGRPQHVIFNEKPAIDLYEIAEDHLKSCLRSEPVNIEGCNKGPVKYFDSIGASGDFIGSALDLSMDSSLSSSGSPVSINGSSLARRRAFREYKMTCYLGPFLEEDECQKCCLKWIRTNKDVCLTKPLNGYEKVGKELAEEFNVEFVDLSAQEEDEEFFDAMSYNDDNINADVDEDEFFDAPQEFTNDITELSDLFTQKCLVKSPLRTGRR